MTDRRGYYYELPPLPQLHSINTTNKRRNHFQINVRIKSKQKKTLNVENQLRRNAFNLELKREIVAALFILITI